jgi:hypothetical protein
MRERIVRFGFAILLLLSIAPLPAARAQPQANPKTMRVKEAIRRGISYLKAQQKADGSYGGKWAAKHAYPNGPSALVTFTLLKCGVKANDPIIKKALHFLRRQQFRKVYSVSLIPMALEAKYEPPREEALASGEPYEVFFRRHAKKHMTKPDKALLAASVAWLMKHLRGGMWTYPYPGSEADLSNTQFALLGLKCARRLGARVPEEAWVKPMDYLLRHQERKGPEVESFSVPAADAPISQLARAKREAEGGTTAGGRRPMQARGWGYRPGSGISGSMTAAGVTCLVVCKSELEDRPGYGKKLGPKVDQAIRDGCAWLAKNFSVDGNPYALKNWLYYYLYTLERAGDLSAVDRFGPHDWYKKGCKFILKEQKPDGRWDPNYKGEVGGPIADTCFAMLFLVKATIPVVERQVTGGDTTGSIVTRKLPEGDYEVTVTFRPEGAARKVAIAGTFNGWDVQKTPMQKAGEAWVVTLKLKPGRYLYKFVIDPGEGERWIHDPLNEATEPDGHGGMNSILIVGF